MRFPAIAFAFALIACSGPTQQTRTAEVPAAVPPADPIDALNARAREGATTDTLHGVSVEDPYRALESDSELTRAWIAAQNARTSAAIQPSDAMRSRLDALLRIGSITDVAVGGDAVFFSRREGDAEQPIVYVDTGTPRAILDPTSFGERAAVDWYYPSPDGRLLAFGISQNGDEKSTLQVLDVESGENSALRIPRTKWSTVSWLPDASGFYYTRYPNVGEPGYDPDSEDHYFPRVFFHALGTDPSDDPLVFGSERGTDFPGPDVSADGRWLVINVHRGWSESDVHLFDRGPRGRRVAPDAAHPIVTVIAGESSLTHGMVDSGVLYLKTNDGAPRYRLVRANPARPAKAQWTTVLAERDVPLEDWALVSGGIAAHYIDDVRSRLFWFDRDGRETREIELPARGAVAGLVSQAGRPDVHFAFEGYLQPPALLRVDGATGATSERARVEADVPFDRFETRVVRVASADGTQVPVTLLQRRGLEPSGDAPVLLYGYGGFNISLLPRLNRGALYWLEQGGVYAVANTRGGGEFGEAWHRGGMLADKQHVFEDFEAVVEWLSTSGLSRPDRIALTGGSNGGLLMGAMITRIPDKFAAAASYVGLYDMVRFHRFPPAELWVTEYGSAETASQFPFIHAYSPYHRVRDGVAYPSVLIETADHDSRVHWAHSTKFAALLQTSTSSDAPIYFFMERAQGHGAGASRSDQAERYARMFRFLADALQIEE